MRAYSHTATDQYDTCPKLFDFARNQRLPRHGSDALDVGAAIHQVLEEYGRHLFAAGWSEDREALEACCQKARAQVAGDAVPDFDAIAERLPEIPFKPDLMEDARFELRLAWDPDWKLLPEWFDKRTRYRQVIDCVHREGAMGVVTDWKTARRIPSQEEARRDPQVRGYAFGMSLLWPRVEEWLVRLVFVRYGYAVREVLLHRDELAPVREEIEGKMARIDADRAFSARIGPHCHWCDYAHRCPAFQKLYAEDHVGQVASAEDARQAFETLTVLQRREKDLRERIQAYVDHAGPIPVGEQLYGYREERTLRFDDPAAVGNALAGQGVPREKVWLALSATKTGVEKALGAAGYRGKAKKQALEALAEKVGREEVKTPLKLHRPRGA